MSWGNLKQCPYCDAKGVIYKGTDPGKPIWKKYYCPKCKLHFKHREDYKDLGSILRR